MTPRPVLEVSDLTVRFRVGEKLITVVDHVAFELQSGEILCLVGESGAGKSTVAHALMRLIDPPGEIADGRALFAGRDLLALNEAEMQAVRGNHICMIFQDPMATLNPLKRIGEQISEGLRLHRGLSRAAAWQGAVKALRDVGIPAPELRARDYPHQLSGGMQQRAIIAAAVAMEPGLIIADEPTTALDATIQSQVLDLLIGLTRTLRTAVILVTHNMALVAEVADTIGVMYAGALVELGPKAAVLDQPRHPYTAALIGSIPRADEPERPFVAIPGMMPSVSALPAGCLFHPRCAQMVRPDCLQRPALTMVGQQHWSACHFAELEITR